MSVAPYKTKEIQHELVIENKSMAELFSTQWMKSFQDEWNNEPGLAKDLAQIKFSSSIGYGFKNEEHPRGVIVINKGKAISAGV